MAVKAVGKDACRLRTLRQHAVALYRAGRLHGLEAACARIVRMDPDDIHARFLLGLALRGQGRVQDACALLVAAANDSPENPDYLLAAADVLYRLGAFQAAVPFLERFIARQPARSDAHTSLGICQCAAGRPRAALQAFRAALRIEPGNADVLVNLGNALQELGRKRVAAACYRRALERDPRRPDAWYNLHAAVFRDDDPSAAIRALGGALRLDAQHDEARAHLAMLLETAGRTAESRALFRELDSCAPGVAHLVESWRYIQAKRDRHTRLFAVTFDALRYAFARAGLPGLVLEFGVRHGTTLGCLALQTRDGIDAFDSFRGLPEAWKGGVKGDYSTFGERPAVAAHVRLHEGWFADSLPAFCAQNAAPVRFMHVDCDLYSSTRTVLAHLAERIVPGSVILFDEYIANPMWREDEFRAFQELVQARGLAYDYLLFSPFTRQAAVRIR